MEVKNDRKGKKKVSEPLVGKKLPKSRWTKGQVVQWLENNSYLPAMNEFVESKVNGADLLNLMEAHLKKYSTSKSKTSALFSRLHFTKDKQSK